MEAEKPGLYNPESKPPDSDSPLEWALYYAARDHAVFPLYEIVPTGNGGLRCSCGQPDCGKNAGKHPRTAHGFHDATTDQDQIRNWWTRWPKANIGIRTGNGYIVLDVDVYKGGDESLDALEHKYGKLPETRVQLTGSRSYHHWFRLPEGVKIGCFNGFEDGLDIRGDGGYVVVEPSNHRSGNIYRWDGLSGFEEPVADIPPGLLRILRAKSDKTSAGGEGWRGIDIQTNRHPELPTALLEFIEADSELSALWNLRRPDLADAKTGRPDLSRYDIRLAKHFLTAGLTHQQAADIITTFRLKHGNANDKGHRLDYLQRTIWMAAEGGHVSANVPDADRPIEHNEHRAGEPIEDDAGKDDLNANADGDGATEPVPQIRALVPLADAQPPETVVSAPEDQDGDEHSAHETRQPDDEGPAQTPKHPYRQKHGCLFRVKLGRDGSEEWLPLTNFAARIVADIVEDDGVEVKALFQNRRHGGTVAVCVHHPSHRLLRDGMAD